MQIRFVRQARLRVRGAPATRLRGAHDLVDIMSQVIKSARSARATIASAQKYET